MSILKKHIDLVTIGIVFIFSVWLAGNLGAFDQQKIENDIICYHAYAPALFVKKDLKLNFYKDSVMYYADRGMYWAVVNDKGQAVIKTSCGQELMYLPFTMWVFMYHAGDNVTGYEIPFSCAICVSTLVYFLLTLLILRKILQHFSFSANVISLTLLCFTIGTNIISFVTDNLGTAHITDIFLVTCLMYVLIKWFEKPAVRYSVLIGACLGMLVLIRPTNIIFGTLLPLFGVNGFGRLKDNLIFLLKHAGHIVLIAVFAFLTFSPQLFYWKYATGNWFYFSYVGERFFFDHPHLVQYLFGFRKGWIIYSPLVVFAFIGLFRRRENQNVFFTGSLLIIAVMIYLNSSWWCWWFGGGFGSRSMIEVYPLLLMGFAAFFEWMTRQKLRRAIAGTLFVLLLSHNIKSSYLNRINKIHYDSMTFAAYKYLFFKIVVTDEESQYLETLYVHPDYDKARKGIDT